MLSEEREAVITAWYRDNAKHFRNKKKGVKVNNRGDRDEDEDDDTLASL